MCTNSECVACRGDVVLDSGVCNASETCAKTDGTRCVACKTGSILFDALTCVAEGDCVEYVDGACVRCREAMALDVESGACVRR